MTIAKAIARAWSDPDYRGKLTSDPRAALAEVGVEIPAGTNLKVVEDTADTKHVVLPVSPADAGEASMNDLEKVAGGLLDTLSPSL